LIACLCFSKPDNKKENPKICKKDVEYEKRLHFRLVCSGSKCGLWLGGEHGTSRQPFWAQGSYKRAKETGADEYLIPRLPGDISMINSLKYRSLPDCRIPDSTTFGI
jgi:hypothetical protein